VRARRARPIRNRHRYPTPRDQAEYGIDVVLDEWQGERGDFRFGIRFDSTGKQLED
jgi:hypothetical protein